MMSASSPRRPLSTLAAIALSAWSAAAQQPTKKGTANTFEVVGNSGVSAQQVCPAFTVVPVLVLTQPIANRCSLAPQIECVTNMPTVIHTPFNDSKPGLYH